ncbi:MAG: hypothetical protein ACXWC4_03330 [Telluria sp.]
MTGRIEALKKRRDVLDAKLRELAAKEARKSAQLDKRRKIILGGWLMKHRLDLVQKIVENGLEREQDQNAFLEWASSSAAQNE